MCLPCVFKKGGLGKAAVGGALFGGVGAVVGGSTGSKKTKQVCEKLNIKITLKNMNNPIQYIHLINSPTKKDSMIYKSIYSTAQECLASLQVMCDSVQANAPVESNVSGLSQADELLKFKQLLDSGVITQEEFDAKKKQLLGL